MLTWVRKSGCFSGGSKPQEVVAPFAASSYSAAMSSETPLAERLRLEAQEAKQASRAAFTEQKRQEDLLRDTKTKWLDEQAELQKSIDVNNAVLAAAGKLEKFTCAPVDHPEDVVYHATIRICDKDNVAKVAMEVRVKPQGHIQVQIPGKHHDDYIVGQMSISAWSVLLNELHSKLPK